jgi:hypothetical protein
MATTKYIINELSNQTITGDLNIFGNLSGSTFYGDGSNLGGVEFTGGTVSGATTFTNGLSGDTISATTFYGDTIFTNSISGNTMSATTFYGDGSNLGGVVGLTYDDLGFTVTSLPSGINQDVVLPYNATVTYPTPLIIGGGYVLTVPAGTTLTII